MDTAEYTITIIYFIVVAFFVMAAVFFVMAVVFMLIIAPLIVLLQGRKAPKDMREAAREHFLSMIKGVRNFALKEVFFVACAIGITWAIHATLGLGPFHLVEEVYGGGYKGDDYDFITYTFDTIIILCVMVGMARLLALFFGKGRRGRREKSAGNDSGEVGGGV